MNETFELLTSITQNIPEGIYRSTADKKLVYANNAFVKMFKYDSVEELLQTNNSLHVNPQQHEEIISTIKLQQHCLNYETQFLCKDGTMFWGLVNANGVFDEHHTLKFYDAVITNITERKKTEEQIQTALKKEKNLGELRSRFISMASHEFRTPLAGILSSAEILDRYDDKLTENNRKKNVQRIQESVKHMTRLLEDILLVGKSDAGKLEIQRKPVNIQKLCNDIIQELELNVLRKTNQIILFHSTNIATHALLDEKMIWQILENLLSNAIKYSPPNSTIIFTAACSNNTITFSVQDQGIGIPKEDIEQLFQPFHRAKNVGTIQGTGLGLVIVKRSVELHGGNISIESDTGKGTTCTITLPLIKENV